MTPGEPVKSVGDSRRVLIAVQSTGVGGMETHAVDLGIELVRRGCQVDLVLPEAAVLDDLAGRASSAGVDVWRLNTVSTQGRLAQALGLASLAYRLARGRPDVVHLHTGNAIGGLAVVVLARLLTPATVVLTEHQEPASDPSAHQRLSRAIKDRLVHVLVAVSRRNASLRAKHLGVDSRYFASVLNGVPIDHVSPLAQRSDRERVRAELRISGSTIVIGCLARLAPDKGLSVLVRAFALLPAEPHSTLLLVGDGPIRSNLEQLAKDLGVAERVVFAGHQPRPTPYLDAMDIFALAVPSGSMSIALLEAMARGLPPIITFGGPEEPVVADRTGLLAPPDDPEGLSSALKRLVSDQQLALKLGAAASTHVRRYFSVARVADDLLEVYAVRQTGGLPDRLRALSPAAVIDSRALLPDQPLEPSTGRLYE